MKFGQLIECNIWNIFLEKSDAKYGGEVHLRDDTGIITISGLSVIRKFSIYTKFTKNSSQFIIFDRSEKIFLNLSQKRERHYLKYRLLTYQINFFPYAFKNWIKSIFVIYLRIQQMQTLNVQENKNKCILSCDNSLRELMCLLYGWY